VARPFPGSAQFLINDYRGNLDSSERELVVLNVVNSTGDPGGIDITLIETGPNTGNFTHPAAITFTRDPTVNDSFVAIDSSDKEEDNLFASLSPVINATYDSPSIASLIFAGKEIPQRSLILQRSELTGDPSDDILVAKVTRTTAGAVASATDPNVWQKPVYLLGEKGRVTVFDDRPQFVNGGVQDCRFGAMIVFNTLTNFMAVPICEESDGNGGFKDGHFFTNVGTAGVNFVSTASNKAIKDLQVSPGDTIMAQYRLDATDPSTWLETNTGISSDLNLRVAPDIIGVNAAIQPVCGSTDALGNVGNDNDTDALCNDWEIKLNSSNADIAGLHLTDDGTSGGVELYFLPCAENIVPDGFGGFTGTEIIDEFGVGLCPDPNRKDIYVEYDYQEHFKPDDGAILDVIEAFNRAPVENPGISLGNDEPFGIKLHVLRADTHVVFPPGQIESVTLAEILVLKTQNFGTPDEIASGGTNSFGVLKTPEDWLTGKRVGFHWGFSINNRAEAPGSSGYGEMNGNDFWVSLGEFAQGRGTRGEQPATFMHEIGHNLNLDHGGFPGNDFNCRPNYLSIMNYLFQFTDIVGDRPLDFSRKQLDYLYYDNLYEPDGVLLSQYPNPGEDTANFINDRPSEGLPTTQFTMSSAYGGPNGEVDVFLTGTAVDWDRQNGIETDINLNATNADLTRFDLVGCGPATTVRLLGYDDWDNIDMNFRDSGFFASGGGRSDDREPGKPYFAEVLSKQLNPLRSQIAQIPDEPQNLDCIADLNGRVDAMQAILTGPDKRYQNLEAVVVEIDAMTTELANPAGVCVGVDTGDTGSTGGDFKDGILKASQGIMEGILGRDSVDVASHGVISATIFGTPQFDVNDIDVTTVKMVKEVNGLPDDFGAPVTHKFKKLSQFLSHVSLVNPEDTIEDLTLHFRTNEVGLTVDPDNPNQRICMTGSQISQQALFSMCRELFVGSSINSEPTLQMISVELPSGLTSSPPSGSFFPLIDVTVTYKATAFDAEDGDISGNINWFSDRFGTLATGDTLEFNILTDGFDGTHLITAQVRDSDRSFAAETRDVSFGGLADVPLFKIELDSFNYFRTGGSNNDKHLTAEFTVVDLDGDPISDVMATLQLFRNNALIKAQFDTSDNNGLVSITKNNIAPAEFTTAIVDLSSLSFSFFGPSPLPTFEQRTILPVEVSMFVTDNTPSVGDTIIYTIRVTNQGVSSVNDVKVTFTLPAGLENLLLNPECTPNGTDIVCNIVTIDALGPGSTGFVDITYAVDVELDASGTIFTTATYTESSPTDISPDSGTVVITVQ